MLFIRSAERSAIAVELSSVQAPCLQGSDLNAMHVRPGGWTPPGASRCLEASCWLRCSELPRQGGSAPAWRTHQLALRGAGAGGLARCAGCRWSITGHLTFEAFWMSFVQDGTRPGLPGYSTYLSHHTEYVGLGPRGRAPCAGRSAAPVVASCSTHGAEDGPPTLESMPPMRPPTAHHVWHQFHKVVPLMLR